MGITFILIPGRFCVVRVAVWSGQTFVRIAVNSPEITKNFIIC